MKNIRERDDQNMEKYRSVCCSLAKAYTTVVRLYQEGEPVYCYSPYPIEPDPLQPFLHQILDSGHEAGIITTPLCQFYGFLNLPSELCMILGPTCVLKEEETEIEELMTTLKISPDDRKNYIRTLCSAPVIHIERLAWLLVSLATIFLDRTFSIEEIWMDQMSESNWQSFHQEYIDNKMNNIEDMGLSQAVKQSLYWEQLITSYVKNGQTEQLREVFDAPPKVYAGSVVHRGMHRMRIKGISMATCLSRAAIEGGLDPQQAFLRADLYIQKLELMQDYSSIERLIQEMILDFSEQVEKLQCPTDHKSPFCRKCVVYISQNIFAAIRIENMAKELGYSRSYLCSHFKQEMGISLTQYIQQKKIEEAKRLLQFSDHHLSEIASLLNFSSQSHFQTIFKKITGETPLSYRKRVKI